MADGDQRGGQLSERFDRVARPAPGGRADRDHSGKEALYSTAPSAPPSSQVLVVCERCDVETGLSVVETARLLVPPVLWNPVTGRLWARCPACDRRSKLRVRQGQALRALLHRE
jgi:hypothetical protein